jgi:hypothetical protein
LAQACNKACVRTLWDQVCRGACQENLTDIQTVYTGVHRGFVILIFTAFEALMPRLQVCFYRAACVGSSAAEAALHFQGFYNVTCPQLLAFAPVPGNSACKAAADAGA